MSFSGKKFRRIACENIDSLMKSSDHLAAMLRSSAPTFSYTRVDAESFHFVIALDERVTSFTFKLGQEFEMERIDGQKIRITYTLEGDDVLNQMMKLPDN